MELDSSLQTSEDLDSLNCTVIQLDGEGELRRSRSGTQAAEEGDEDEVEVEGLLRLPQMTDTSMNSVGQPLRDVMDRLNGALEKEEAWNHLEGEEKKNSFDRGSRLPAQQPFREESGGEPPDPPPGETSHSTWATSTNLPQDSPVLEDLCCFTQNSSDSSSTGGGHHDSTEHSQSHPLSGGHEDEGEAKAPEGLETEMKKGEEDAQEGDETDKNINTTEKKLSPSESSHPAEFK